MSQSDDNSEILKQIQSQALHKSEEAHYAREKTRASRQLKDKYESHADVQRHRTQLTPEQKTREAIDRMIPSSKELLRMRTGKEPTHEEARKYAENLAYKSERDKR